MMNFAQAERYLAEGDKIVFTQGQRKQKGSFRGSEVLPDGRKALRVELPELDLGDGHTAVTVLTIADNELVTFEKETPLKADLIVAHEIKLNIQREAELAKGAETSLGKIDITGNSLALINLAATRALLAQFEEKEFSEEWTLYDNTVVKIDHPDTMIQLAKEAAEAVSKIYEDIREKKKELRKLTKEEIEKFKV